MNSKIPFYAMDMTEILAENKRRNEALKTDYDPIRGIGCAGERLETDTPMCGLPKAFLPRTMVDDPLYVTALDETQWITLRCRHDFEYWCVTCVRIKDKTTGLDVPFRLNDPQRRVAAIMENDRLAGRPIRMIMLKARQWGGSTLVQMYMAWIQSCHRRNWNSLICAHVKDTAAGIRGMYTKMLANYPLRLWEGEEPPAFRPYERSINVREISGRGCRVTLGSSENQESVRGGDYAMAHLSETAFWSSTQQRSPEKFIRAICGSIALIPYSLIVMESTANGVGNFFHSEWLRCKAGKGDKHAVFVPWHEIEIYRMNVADPERLWKEMTPYEHALWEKGLTLEMIQWYHLKASEYPTPEQMHAEFPGDDTEAFLNTGRGVFACGHIEALRQYCREPSMIAAVNSEGKLVGDPGGLLKIWKQPVSGAGYVVSVDVGGRSRNSDWSVIAVLSEEEVPEVVAQWRGHVDHDLLALESARIASCYNDALLIIESNTFETENECGDSGMFILNRLKSFYGNLYCRESTDRLTDCPTRRPGFHTNRSTKAMIIAGLIEAVRDGKYIERDNEACNELATYEQLPNGTFAAKTGYHDDILMTRAIALHVLSTRCRHDTDLSPLIDYPSW